MEYILYLHGFHSSPGSLKCRQFIEFVDERCPTIQVIAPQLAAKPQQLKSQLQTLFEQYRFIGVVGSSMGGFLATYVSHCLAIPAVLVNPAVKPDVLIESALGAQIHPITKEQYDLDRADQDALRELAVDNRQLAQPMWVLLQQGDEVLDYRAAIDAYTNSRLTLESGGSHAFDGFERYLDDIVHFVGQYAFDRKIEFCHDSPATN